LSHHSPLFYGRTEREESMIRSSEVVFLIQRQDVLNCAAEMGIPAEDVTDDIIDLVRKGVQFGLECWTDVVKEALSMSLKS